MIKTLSDKNVEYDLDLDALYISKHKAKKEVIGSFSLGNFVIDIDVDGSIVGLEIDNASEILGVKPALLSEAKDGNITVFIQNNVLLIRYRIIFGRAQTPYTGVCAIPQNKINMLKSRGIFA